jgi:ZIP family zinc transporter
MSESSAPARPWRTAALFALPVVLLAGVIAAFLAAGGLRVQPAAPIESLVFERTVVKPEAIQLHVRNTSPQALTVAQINIRDAFVPFRISPGTAIPRLGRAVITVPYPWVQAETYQIRLFSSNSVPFDTVIEAAAETRRADRATLGGFTLIGIYVGVIPVFLGIFWYPALRRLGRRAFLWLMALTIGLLLFLGIDAASEALEAAAAIGGPFQGVGLTGLGIVTTFLVLAAIARRQGRTGEGRPGRSPRAGRQEAEPARIALMIAVGIGLHNLGEGLAIGAAFSIGAAALGTFLVIGFILQNITEGLGIVAPIVRQKPSLGLLAALGLIGGAPAIVGTWAGGLVYSPVLSVLFLSIGAGAVFEVAYEIGRLIRQEAPRQPFTLASGVVAGMAVLYLTGLLIK